MERKEVSFISGGERIAAWDFAPAGTEGTVPAAVMAHGLGGVREAGLAPYAERFAAAGMRVVVFDYRHLGVSAGEPRQLVDVRRQLADWRAAIAFARSLDGVDPERVAVWGTWQNRMTARLLLRFPLYRRNRRSDRIACPLIVCVCDRDGVTPPGAAVTAAERAPRGEAIHYDGRHFDIYVGELFERAVSDQTAFLSRTLLA